MLPPTNAFRNAHLTAKRSVRIVADRPSVDALVSELGSTLQRLSVGVDLVDSADDATHVLVVLSGGLLATGSSSAAEFERLVTTPKRKRQAAKNKNPATAEDGEEMHDPVCVWPT